MVKSPGKIFRGFYFILSYALKLEEDDHADIEYACWYQK